MYKLRSVIIVNLFVFLSLAVQLKAQSGQGAKNTDPLAQIRRYIRISPRANDRALPFYVINFKLDLVRNHDGSTTVTKMTANDSLAFQIIADTKFIRKIDYRSYGYGKNKFSLLIPILISNDSKLTEGRIDADAAINAMVALYSPGSYDNINDPRFPPGYHKRSDAENQQKRTITQDSLIYLPLTQIRIHSIICDKVTEPPQKEMISEKRLIAPMGKVQVPSVKTPH